jgi:hypothetical protein
MVSRQMGKSTVAVGYLLWYAMFNPDATVLIASNKHDGALEIMQRLRFAYENVPDHIRSGVLSYNKKSIEFDNGSRVISQTTTSNTGRGLSISLIYLDEFAFVERNIARELWTSLSPTLSTGGKIIITSTPDTTDDQFSELWFAATKMVDDYGNATEVGVNGFRPFFADWKEHPDRDEQWAEEQRSELGVEKFLREHCCEFITFEETLINSVTIMKAESKEPIRTQGNVRWYSELNPESTYIVGLDPAMGTGGDAAAIQVFEMPSLKQVAEWRHNRTIIERQVSILRDVLRELESAGVTEIYWSVENNAVGEAALVVIRDTGEESFPGNMLHDPRAKGGSKRKGFTTTNKSKLEACSKFKSLYESGRMKLFSKAIISELSTFVSRGVSYEARSGSSDDLISATLLCIRMMEFVAQWDEDSHNVMSSNIGGADEDEEDYESPMPIAFI